mmetsp:Transcript_95771/g.154473  ORF Transcript_95771/g.154473 Transcript_95771/m.154473 type:complete len:82 (-) Transcript_95771:128-373(-)
MGWNLPGREAGCASPPRARSEVDAHHLVAIASAGQNVGFACRVFGFPIKVDSSIDYTLTGLTNTLPCIVLHLFFPVKHAPT